MSDVPFGVFLSGGVDSSTNVALMSELMDRPGPHVLGRRSRSTSSYNELDYARQVAERFETDHHEVMIDWDDARVVPARDDPPPGRADRRLGLRAAVLRRQARARQRHDRRAGGRGRRRDLPRLPEYSTTCELTAATGGRSQRVPRPLRRRGPERSRRCHRRRTRRDPALGSSLERGGRVGCRSGAARSAYQGELKEQVLANGHMRPTRTRSSTGCGSEAERDRPGADLLQKMTYLELKQRLPELLLMRVDKMTMATSVEARVPVPRPPARRVRAGTAPRR